MEITLSTDLFLSTAELDSVADIDIEMTLPGKYVSRQTKI